MKYLAIFLVVIGSLFAANEIHVDYDSGATLYSCRFVLGNGNVFLTDGTFAQVWSTADSYDVTMTENGVGGHFVGSFDASANISDGTYKVTVFEQLGASPANSDRAIYVGEIKWKDGAEDRNAAVSDITATDAELAKVPKSDGSVTWNATALASINAEADTALTDYDGPTKTEMDTAHALLATEAKQDIIDGNVDSILTLATFMRDVMEGDVWIDVTPTPWQVVTSVKEAGGGVGGAELIRKDLKTISDGNVTSSNARVDRTVEP